MADYCNLCGKKIGFFSSYSITPKEIAVCEHCNNDYAILLESAKKNNNFDIKIENFRNKYANGQQVDYCVRYVTGLHESLENVHIKDQERKNQLELERLAQQKKKEDEEQEKFGPFTDKPYVYSIDGVRGRHIDVYNDKVVINTSITLGSILTNNAHDGEKTIYFSDCIGVQFKETTYTIGYLQIETAATSGNNLASNFFHENSFTYDTTVISNEKMREVADFVKKRVEEIKNSANVPEQSTPAPSNLIADELLKLKQLVDMGVLTQEEFDEQKRKLLQL